MNKEQVFLTKVFEEREKFNKENEKYPEVITISNEIYQMLKNKQIFNDGYFTKPKDCANEEFLGMIIKISLQFKLNEFQLN